VDQRRTDTREQIQNVALELFAERGYDRASLREIAERLNVTKAALYYHFRTKDDILASVIEDFLVQLDALVDWAHGQPSDIDVRDEVLRRYSALLTGRTAQLARFMREGMAKIPELALGMKIRAHFAALIDVLAGPGDPTAGRLRAQVALAALQLATLSDPDLNPDDDATERRAAALTIATEIVHPLPRPAVETSRR
jgi:AcrR family transcriptional regulator